MSDEQARHGRTNTACFHLYVEAKVYLEDTETRAVFTRVGEGFGGGKDGDRWAQLNRGIVPNIPLHRRMATVDSSQLNTAKEVIRILNVFNTKQWHVSEVIRMLIILI